MPVTLPADTAKPRRRTAHGAPARSRIWRAIRDALPQGQTLPYDAWARRHRALMWILWAHVVVLPVFALFRGYGPATAFGSVVPVALAGLAGTLKAPGRRARSVAVVLGLLTS